MTLVDVQDLVEATRDMEAHGWHWLNVATLRNLLVRKPALVGKRKLELVAILACALRAEAWQYLRDVEVADAEAALDENGEIYIRVILKIDIDGGI